MHCLLMFSGILYILDKQVVNVSNVQLKINACTVQSTTMHLVLLLVNL